MTPEKQTDLGTIRQIIFLAAGLGVLALLAGFALTLLGHRDAALILFPVFSGVPAALLALLARTRTEEPADGKAMDVRVTNDPGNPGEAIPTTETAHATPPDVDPNDTYLVPPPPGSPAANVARPGGIHDTGTGRR